LLTPPPLNAALPLTVLLLRVEPPSPRMPPPSLAVLLLTVLLLMMGLVIAVMLRIRLAPGLFLGVQGRDQNALIVLGMLQETLFHDAVVRGLRIAGQREILVDDLLRRAADLALRSRAVIDAVDIDAAATATAATLAVAAPA